MPPVTSLALGHALALTPLASSSRGSARPRSRSRANWQLQVCIGAGPVQGRRVPHRHSPDVTECHCHADGALAPNQHITVRSVPSHQLYVHGTGGEEMITAYCGLL